MLAASTGKAKGKQNKTSETIMYTKEVKLMNHPYRPSLNGPKITDFRRVIIWAIIGMAYETVPKTTKDPTNALKAVVLPT
jgi:hypothetical protein